MLFSFPPMLIAAQSSVWYATALKARYGKNVTDLLAGGSSVTEINPMYNCEVVTLDPVTVHNFEGPALDLEIIVEMRNLWLDPYGANTGWTLESNAPSGIEFIAYKHTATVSSGNTYTAPPFRFILTVGDNSGHFNIHLGTQSSGTAYSFLGNALSEPAITLSGLVSDIPASIKPDCNPFNGPINPLYLVTGDLIVDENLCLTPSIDPNFPTTVKRAKVFVQSGHSITVTDDALFSVEQADFQGCEFLWKGIVVEPSGKLIADQAEIRDAYDGVEIQRGGQARVENSAFYNNVRGLFVNGNTGTGNPPFLETCFGNTFATLVADGDEWPMKQSENTAQLPNPVFKRAEQGIFAEDAGFIITSDNTFQRLARYGIHALRTNTEVYESVFSRINPSESYLAQSGTGVFFREGNALTVTGAGNGASDPVGFEHLTTGIFALKPVEFNVTDCKMENIRQGMMLNGGIWPEIESSVAPSAVSLYPNPGSGVFSIQGLSNESAECLVFDAQGRMVRQTILTEPILDLSVLPEGAYSVRIVQQGKTYNIKVIILK